MQTVIHPDAKRFLEKFLRDRAINREFYKRVSDDKLDYRMVDTPGRKSDSPRESLIHQIYVTCNYIHSAKIGEQEWTDERYDELMSPEIKSYSKDQLLIELEKTEQELIALLHAANIAEKTVKVSWSDKPISALSSLWGLDSHEVLHQGWNLAIMDHLDIERFPLLKDMWG